MSFSVLSIAIILLFAVISAIEIFRGIKNGFVRSAMSLGVVIASIIISVIVSPLIAKLISTVIVKLILVYTPLYELYESVLNTFPSAEELLIAVLSIVISVFLFIVVFFVSRWIIKLLAELLRAICTKKRRDDVGHNRERKETFHRSDKLMGGLAGALSAIMVTMVILTPFMGVLDCADRVSYIVESASEKAWDRTILKKSGVETIRRVGKDLPCSIFYHLGGKYIFRAASSTTMYGESVYLIDEIDSVYVIVDNFFDTYKVIQSPKKATPEQVEKIKEIGVNIKELKILRGILADFVSDGASAWLEGKSYMKVRKPTLPALIEPAFNDVLAVCSQSNENSVGYNVVTITNIIALAVESDLLHAEIKSYSDAMEFIEDTHILDKINAELAANPYMSDIKVSSVIMSVMSQYVDPSVIGNEKYDNLMNGMADAINTVKNRGYSSDAEEQVILQDYAQKYIEESGLDIPEDFAIAVAEEMLKAFENVEGDVTSADVEAAFSGFSQ